MYNIGAQPPYLIEGFGGVHKRSVAKLLSSGMIRGAGDGLTPETPQSYIVAQVAP